MAALEVLALVEGTPQIRAPGAGDTYTMPRALAITGSLTLSADAILQRDAANTLALRNSTNAQAFNIYNTYTDASNYERGFVRNSSNELQIGYEVLGTGSNRNIAFVNGGAARFIINTSGHSGIASGRQFYLGATGTLGSTSLSGVYIYQNGTGILGVTGSSGAAIEMTEMTAPAAGAANTVRIYAQDNGGGKTQLMALFSSGAAQQIAIQP